jgi:hypothetical protein
MEKFALLFALLTWRVDMVNLCREVPARPGRDAENAEPGVVCVGNLGTMSAVWKPVLAPK